MQRRDFLTTIMGAASASALFTNEALAKLQAATEHTVHLSPQEAARDETLWREVQNAFSVNRNYINLDNGNLSPSPKNVTEAMIRYIWELQDAPGLMLWSVLKPLLDTVRISLARSFGADAEEIVLVRNTTEAMNIVLLGVPLQPGDEILTATHDYSTMQDTINERARRDNIVVKKISNVPMPPKSMGELVEMYEQNITPRTKLLLLTHPVSYTGQLFPVKEICEMAHRKGVEVVVDGAQSFAHVDYKLSDLGCDYFAASLHKWLSAPIGNGLLYIRKDKIAKVRQLIPSGSSQDASYQSRINKFENYGTPPLAPAARESKIGLSSAS